MRWVEAFPNAEMQTHMSEKEREEESLSFVQPYEWWDFY